jgi:hypothetical protein
MLDRSLIYQRHGSGRLQLSEVNAFLMILHRCHQGFIVYPASELLHFFYRDILGQKLSCQTSVVL